VRAFGIGFEHRGLREVARRTTYLVDERGIVRNVWAYDTGEVPDVEEWVAAARALNRTA
jgi:peroxiredoxin